MRRLAISVLLGAAIAFGLTGASGFSGNSGAVDEPAASHRPAASAQTGRAARTPAAGPGAFEANIPYIEAAPILKALEQSLLPGELRAKTPAALESAWSGWVSSRDAAIRARLVRGDEDSIVNFLLFGTTFTKLTRATERDLATLPAGTGALPSLFTARIEDFIAGLVSPGANERLQFAREVVTGRGIDPATAAGKDQARRFLGESLTRVSAEIVAYDRALQSARLSSGPVAELRERSTMFRGRGLSSDTSIFTNLAVEQTLAAITSNGLLGPGSVRRVAIVGPGLDFANKHGGYDFYPEQTIQPFAVIDSLIRLGLSTPDDLRTTTFDVSRRINRHLGAARERARAGGAYALQVPRNTDLPWTPTLVKYWERFGDQIGEEVKAGVAPPSAGTVRVRAVRVRPAVVLSIEPRDLNIVLQRLEPLRAEERFDLIVATDILIYYDVFEQSLALVNIARMLRPGGFFLSNNAIFELPAVPLESIAHTDVIYMRLPDVGETGDRVIWYRRP